MQTIIINDQQAGQRLDQFLTQNYPDLSRTKIKKILDEGKYINVNDRKQKPSYKIVADDIIKIYSDISKLENDSILLAESIPLDILYENQDYLIINKPANLVVHPSGADQKNTLVNALLSYYPEISSATHDDSEISKLRPGIVHRLDKDTTGAIVIAKNKLSLKDISSKIKKRQFNKTYQTIVAGWTPEKGDMIGKISRDKKHRTKMSQGLEGKDAISHYITKKYFQTKNLHQKVSLLEVKIRTGRTHQIRVQLKDIGFPVLGDKVYYTKESKMISDSLGIKRQMLHAKSVKFKSIENKIITSETNLPEDFKQTLFKLVEIN